MSVTYVVRSKYTCTATTVLLQFAASSQWSETGIPKRTTATKAHRSLEDDHSTLPDVFCNGIEHG